MIAEVHALVWAFDHRYFVRQALEELLGRQVEMESFVDSRTLFNIIAKNNSTAQGRLQINVWVLKESYKRGQLTRPGLIPMKKTRLAY